MPADLTLKQGDTRTVATDTLTYSDGTPVNLTGASVQFVMRSLASPTALALTGTTQTINPYQGTVQFSPSAADVGTAGQYMATWIVTYPDASVMTFPTRGYIWITVEENLTTAGGQQLVSLPEVKDYLNIPSNDRTHDHKLIDLLSDLRPVIEKITGPIIPAIYEEWHDGGQYFIQIRRRPSTGYGTTPILDLIGADEYRGPIKYSLKIVKDPSAADIYSVHMDPLGKIVRRSTGGGVVAFPAMPESVHIWYRAGQQQVPGNVRRGALELVRVNYETTMATGRGSQTVSDFQDQSSGPPMGFFVPRRVRELLSPTRRAPTIA